MRILLTNITLACQTGTEIVTRDLALGLLAKGHAPAVYTPNPGIVAEQIERGGVRVFEKLDAIRDTPDIIHGHHMVETVSALLQFPATPGIFVCHDRLIWHDAPPPIEHVRKFVAVDRNCLERLTLEAAIPADRTRLIFNAVDTSKFLPREPLPVRPKRALIFSNYARPGTHLEPIQQACRQLGIALDVMGTGMGTGSDAPEHLLANYDIVFAKARCALEAMAAGCAVILCDTRGLGGLVREENVATLREWNFGMRCLTQPASPGLIIREILAYDSANAAGVSAFIRKTASLDGALEEYISLYREVIAEEPKTSSPVTAPDVISAIARKAGALEDRLRTSRRLFLPPLPAHIGNHIHLRITSPPGQMAPGSRKVVRISIRNDSAELLASIGPNPVRCSYHWLSSLTREPVQFDGQRTLLTADIAPRTQHEQGVDVLAPAIEGEYLLRMTLVQEDVFWFDNLTPPVAADAPITVSVSEPNTHGLSLQQVAISAGLRIVRDAAFSNLGFVNDSLPNSLCFVETEAFAKQAEVNPNISAVITRPNLSNVFSERLGLAISDSPRHTFAVLHNRLASDTQFYWTDFPSVIHASARIHPKSCIAEHNVIVGANVLVHADATILERTFIEEGAEILPGAVLGSVGFQTIRGSDSVIDLAHAGGIRVGPRAHILANAVIARGVFRQMTEIGHDARIGNGAFISHNSCIGPNSFVGHGAVVNGNVGIGSNAWIGPGATIVHGVRIGDGAHVSFGSAVMRDVAPGERVIGSIALPQRKMFRMIAALNR